VTSPDGALESGAAGADELDTSTAHLEATIEMLKDVVPLLHELRERMRALARGRTNVNS